MKKRVLLTGGSGLLALNWAVTIRDRYAVTLAMHDRMVLLSGTDSKKLDLSSVDNLVRSLAELSPEMVIHAVALTNIEMCERMPEHAAYVNVVLAGNVAKACAQLGIPLVYISTDHLFSGDFACVVENQPVAPRNVYAKTKAEAENEVLKIFPEALILRTNFYGWGPSYRKSFSDVIIDALNRGEALNLFEDVFYTPILAEVLVSVAHELVDMDAHGVFHIVGDERISKFDFGLKLAQILGFGSHLVKPGILADMPDLVCRPYDMSLSNQKICDFLGRKMGSVEAHIRRLLEQKQAGVTRDVIDL